MNLIDSRWLRGLLETSRPEPAQQAERIVAMQLHIVLPAKAGLIAVVLYYHFSSDAFLAGQSTYSLMLEILRTFFFIYVAGNFAAGLFFYFWHRFPPVLFQWLVFTLGILDGLFIAGLAFMTDGFESMSFWLFPGLIVLNAISIPLAMPQIVLNLLLSVFYLSAGILNAQIPFPELATLPPNMVFHQTTGMHPTPEPVLPYHASTEDASVEPDLPRLAVLWLLTICCYGVQVLLQRQRQAAEEAGEFAAREGQLHSAGRLAAEFAHQIKNPLAIINSAAFSLQRALRENKPAAPQQIEIIQEEVARADKVITQIMGYAQLSEGRVEKLNVVQEIERAITQAFPAALPIQMKIHRKFGRSFPPLLMQRNHLSEILANLLQNARDALGEKGNIFVTADCRPDYAVEISVRDDGPGIPPEKMERIFEAYYTTKKKGSGLGLAIVKHNAELYGGTVRVKSELDSKLGKGVKFTVIFPAKALMKFSK
jgi:signal transduction histidine kinase